MKKKTFVLLGAGNLATRIAGIYAEGGMPAYEAVGVLGRDPERAAACAGICGCKVVDSIEEAIALDPDYIVEAASIAAVKEHLPKVLEAGLDFVMLSVGAFADETFLEEMKKLAEKTGATIHLPGGAIGGFEVLKSITAMGETDMEFHFTKHRSKFEGTPLYPLCPEEGEPVRVYEGPASEAIELLPRRVNVAVAAAMATVGADDMRVTIDCDPYDMTERITMTIKGPHAEAEIRIDSDPSELVPLSVVTFLNNLASPIHFG